MNKKLSLLFSLTLIFGLLLGACGPKTTPTPQPQVQPTAVVVEPQAPVVQTGPDFDALFAAFWASVPPDQGYGTISAANLNTALAENPNLVLVDVREQSEIETDGYIQGAIHLPIRTLLQNLDKLPGLNDPIVIYCASGHRGALGMMALKMLGYTNVKNLGGGLGAWKSAGLPVVTGSLPAAAPVRGGAVIADQVLFETLDAYLTNLPQGFGTIKAPDLATLLAEKKVTLIDVRSQAEWDKDGHIEGAILIPFPEFLNNLDQLPAEKDAAIIVYCGSGHRGAFVMEALNLMGYTNVKNLGGGLSAWKKAGLPVVGWVDWPKVMGEFVAGLPAEQSYYTITATALNELLATGPAPFLVDVREASEIEASGHIAGAIHLPIRTLLQNLDKLPAQDQPIVVYCGSGHRGALAMVALRLLGYTNVKNLGGGTGAWLKANLTLTPGLPAAAAATGATPTYDATRYAKLNDYLSNLPEGFGTVKAADLNAELAGATVPVLLDVRSAAEVTADGYIQNSLLIPINDLPANLSQLPADKATPIVTICKSGHRGAIAQMYLQFLGYTNVRNLAGGTNAWIAAQLPVVK